MKIRKSLLATTTALLLANGYSHATLINGSTMIFGEGSYFGMELAIDFWIDTPITSFNGINLGTTQLASGSHPGAPDGSESPDIDNPWLFFDNTGMHQTTSPINIISASGNTATLDFSGWDVTFNGIASVPLGSSFGPDSGIATVTCNLDCSAGDQFTLDYLATVPVGDTFFGGVDYRLHLNGCIATPEGCTIAPIPVPAAVWLFASGLLGLIGLAKRKT